METMSNVQGAVQVASELGGDKMIGEAMDIVYEAALALVRFGRRQPLIVVGLAAAAAVVYATLKPATRKSVRASASNFVGSLREIGVTAGDAPASRRRTARGSGARAKRAGRGGRSAARNGRQAHA